ncbi:MAG: chemotaxis protein CheD, partial [Candidatus Hodarchaeales archaeon]
GHIMLSESHKRKITNVQKSRYSVGKYSDQAVPAMLEKLEKLGFSKASLEAKMVGGAKMFANSSNTMDIGKQNIRVTKNLLQKYKVPLIKHYTGGTKGMNVKFIVRAYKLVVTPTGESPVVI